MNLLLSSRRKEASAFILELYKQGMSVKRIYLDIFQSSQYELGLLWESNQITVAHEHYCTASTQMIMSLLYPYVFNTQRIQKSVVAACVGEELHEIGMRMVVDFLELEGWDTYYLGANTPTDAICAALQDQEADILALSITIDEHLNSAQQTIDRVKKEFPNVKIMVGGYPFLLRKELVEQIGADANAASAEQVHKMAKALIHE